MMALKHFFKKFFVPRYVVSGTENDGGFNPQEFSLKDALYRALRNAYLSAFTLRGGNNEAFVDDFEKASFGRKLQIFFGFEKQIVEKTSPHDSLKEKQKKTETGFFKGLAFFIYAIATFIFRLTRFVLEFLPKLLSNISLVLANWAKEFCWNEDNNLGAKFIVAIVIGIPSALSYLSFRAVWAIGRAINSPVQSARRAYQTGQSLLGAGVSGNLLGAALSVVSLGVSAAAYAFLFPLVLKYAVIKGIAQIHQVMDWIHKVMPTLTHSLTHLFQQVQGLPGIGWIMKLGTFINHFLPHLSAIQTAAGMPAVTTQLSALVTGAGAVTLIPAACVQGLVVDPILRKWQNQAIDAGRKESVGSAGPTFFKALQELLTPEKNEFVELEEIVSKDTLRSVF